MTELLNTAPLIVRRHEESPDGPSQDRSYDLFDPQWRPMGRARSEDARGGGRRLLPWSSSSHHLAVFDAHDRPLLGLDRGTGRRTGTTRVAWADGTPLGVFRRMAQKPEVELVDSHGRSLARLDLSPPTGGAQTPGRPSAMERSHRPIVDPDGQEVGVLIREFLPNTPGRYPPHLLTYTLRPHRETPTPLGALLRLTPLVTDADPAGGG